MSPKETNRFLNAVLAKWIELGKPETFEMICPICGGRVRVTERELIFSARCPECGEEI